MARLKPCPSEWRSFGRRLRPLSIKIVLRAKIVLRRAILPLRKIVLRQAIADFLHIGNSLSAVADISAHFHTGLPYEEHNLVTV